MNQQHLSYAIIGTGAVGGFYGACLQKGGADVHFLLHSDYEYVRQHGLTIESSQGDFDLPTVKAYSSVETMPVCDVIVVALKTTANYLLPELLPPILHENSVVLVLQNGLNIEPDVAKIVGDHRVMGGLCFVCSNKVGAGHIKHLDYSLVTLGDYTTNYQPAGITARMQTIAADFQRGDIPIELSEDLLLARWKKLVWNIPYNGLSVVLNAQTDELMRDAGVRMLCEQLMQEVVAGAGAYKRTIPQSFVQKMLDHTAKMIPYRTSMKIDFDEKRPLEVEAIFGNAYRAAQLMEVNLPLISMLYHQLKFIDHKNRQKL